MTAAPEHAVDQARNLLNYTKTSGTVYNGQLYPAGYHTIRVGDAVLDGQRKPDARLALVPYDFTGKRVLDIGSNQGGMLHAIGGRLAWGVGLDYDSRLVNAANRIARIRGDETLGFYTFDLERDPLDLIEDFLPERPDVVFLLAVCKWIENWREVISYLSQLSPRMLFEVNGTPEFQQEQIDFLQTRYNSSTLLARTSDDDPLQKRRQLLWLEV